MNAEEYYQQYHDLIFATDVDVTKFDLSTEEGASAMIKETNDCTKKGVSSLFIALNDEMKATIVERNLESDSSIVECVREYNDMWNEIAHMFEERDGIKVLRRDGFNEFMIRLIPRLKEALDS